MGRSFLFKSYLIKVDDVQHNPNKADLEGTLEGRLKDLRKKPKSRKVVKEKSDILGHKMII